VEDEEGSLPAPPGHEDNASNVRGRQLAPPDEGFGQLWRKELSVTLFSSPLPADVMALWKRDLESLWPERGKVYRHSASVRTGDLVGIDVNTGPVRLSTGGVIVEASAESFTILAPEGHMFAGWTRCETAAGEAGTVARVVIELRASDPLYELGLMMGGHRAEERFWAEMLCNLAARFGEAPKVRLRRRRLDRGRHWGRWANVRHNASVRTTFRRIGRVFVRTG
jgi:hypothetical protein